MLSTILKTTQNKKILETTLKTPELSPEEKTRRAIEMTETVTQICADGIRAHNPQITEEELITELRRRINTERE